MHYLYYYNTIVATHIYHYPIHNYFRYFRDYLAPYRTLLYYYNIIVATHFYHVSCIYISSYQSFIGPIILL